MIRKDFPKLGEHYFEQRLANGLLVRVIEKPGFAKRYASDDPVARERLEYEIGVITQMGYVDYFLIVWDFVKFAKDAGIMVGPGRGSSASSLSW